jgi:hypothetical protein
MTVQTTINQKPLPEYMISSIPRFHKINIQKSLLKIAVMPSSLTLLFNIKYT